MIDEFNTEYFCSLMRLSNIDDRNTRATYEYFCLGFMPGSFFTHLLSNSPVEVVLSHADNSQTVEQWKSIYRILNSLRYPKEFYGSYESVVNWTKKSKEDRFDLLAKVGLILPAKQVLFYKLRGDKPYDLIWEKMHGKTFR